MNKEIAMVYKGTPEYIGFFPIVRSLPSAHKSMVGHFTFLDQMPLKTYPTQEFKDGVEKMGDTSHPHRGIATFTYLLKGGIEHYDSAGNNGIVGEGGIQWMKAGNGIVHEEVIVIDDDKPTITLNGMQFWINLPAQNKAESPDYMAVQSTDIPELQLPDNIGSVRVLVGEYKGVVSPIPTYSELFNYHISINAGQKFTIKVDKNHEVALVVAKGSAVVNGEPVALSELLIFNNEGNTITIENSSHESIDILLFGGEPYTESVVMGGPFIMNSTEGMEQAHRDYHAGKYGTIDRNIKSQ